MQLLSEQVRTAWLFVRHRWAHLANNSTAWWILWEGPDARQARGAAASCGAHSRSAPGSRETEPPPRLTQPPALGSAQQTRSVAIACLIDMTIWNNQPRTNFMLTRMPSRMEHVGSSQRICPLARSLLSSSCQKRSLQLLNKPETCNRGSLHIRWRSGAPTSGRHMPPPSKV